MTDNVKTLELVDTQPIRKIQTMTLRYVNGDCQVYKDFIGHKLNDGWILIITGEDSVDIVPAHQIAYVNITQE